MPTIKEMIKATAEPLEQIQIEDGKATDMNAENSEHEANFSPEEINEAMEIMLKYHDLQKNTKLLSAIKYRANKISSIQDIRDVANGNKKPPKKTKTDE